jgi:DNA-binding transcriptional MerR regulator
VELSDDTLPMFPELEPVQRDEAEGGNGAEADGAERAPAASAESHGELERDTGDRSVGRPAPPRGMGGEFPHGERAVAQREYYSIGEVCELTGLKSHVLRYWESQFPELNPSKNRSGNRVYQRKEIRLILLVKELLYDEKYTIEGARQRLEQLRRGGEMQAAAVSALEGGISREIRLELDAVLRLLTVPEPGE